jgi:peptidyl-prolyl cis-trans isomerase SurA
MKRLRVWICVGLAVGATARAAPVIQAQNGIAAIVNNAVITFLDVENHAKAGIDLLRRTYYSQPDVFNQKVGETLVKALEDLIEIKLILDDFKAQGGTVPDSVIEDEIRDRIRRTYGNRAVLTKTLQAEGMTLEAYRQRLREEIIVQHMRQKNIAQALLISPAKIERYYATNFSKYKLDEQVRLRLIVLKASPGTENETKRRMVEILALIEQGAAFGEMAAVYSEGSARQQQGEVDPVERSKKSGISSVGFELNPGQHSGVIGLARENDDTYWIYRYNAAGQLTHGSKYTARDKVEEERKFRPDEPPPVSPHEFYLVKTEEKRPPRTRSLEEVRDEIEKNLLLTEQARLQKRWIDRLRAKAYVREF